MLKIIAAIYLIYLGITAIFAPTPKLPQEFSHNENIISKYKFYLLGFLTNLLNPKAIK